ncbi:hypothetical protein F4825DRAFT_415409 [Nemania diffusa]|nr:hypothetical protein F4825DRAFT_415409 [Nemania diffusa]
MVILLVPAPLFLSSRDAMSLGKRLIAKSYPYTSREWFPANRPRQPRSSGQGRQVTWSYRRRQPCLAISGTICRVTGFKNTTNCHW